MFNGGVRLKLNNIITPNSPEVKKLVRNYMTHKTIIVAFDYDDTIFPYSKDYDTEFFKEVHNLLIECKSLGYYLILYTCNGSDRYEDMMQYMDDNNIPYDAINKNSPAFGGDSTTNKIFYNILLDDKAGLKQSISTLRMVNNIVKELHKIQGGEQ